SAKLMDRYIDSLDPVHIYFLKSDLEEFAPMRETMGTLLSEKGDTTPATRIFARFLQRFDQNYAYVNELLKQQPPELTDFTSNDTFVLDRKDLPPPQSTDDAKHLWLERLRYEYLQEKLSHTKPEAKPEEIVKTLTRRYARTYQSIHQLDHDDIFE